MGELEGEAFEGKLGVGDNFRSQETEVERIVVTGAVHSEVQWYR